MELGQWANTVSHIKTKGSGGKDFDNVVPMCLTNFCHQKWEASSKENKEELLELAKQLTNEYYFNCNKDPEYEEKRKAMWDDVRERQL